MSYVLLARDKASTCLVGHDELHALLARELLGAGLLCVEVVEARLAADDLAGRSDLETLHK